MAASAVVKQLDRIETELKRSAVLLRACRPYGANKSERVQIAILASLLKERNDGLEKAMVEAGTLARDGLRVKEA